MTQKGIVLVLLLIAGVALIFLLTEGKESVHKKATVGLDAPDIELQDLNGGTWRLSDHRGKAIVLNFWASWCDTCKTEKPSFQGLVTRKKDDPRIVFVTVLYEDDPQKMREFMKASGYGFIVLVDDRRVSKAYGITGVPESFVINGKGRIEEKMIGPVRWDSSRIESLLSRAVAGT